MPENERRRIPRFDRRIRLDMLNSTGFTRNISVGGFCAALRNVPDRGEMVHGAMEGDGWKWAFTGQVRWSVRPVDAVERGTVGVKFTGVDPNYYQLFRTDGTLARVPPRKP